jgi:hypothetical protein
MATPESWSLLQSVYAVRDQYAASRGSILPLVRFIQTPLRRANPTVSTPGTQARHRSSATKPTNHVPPSWFLTTATVYSTSQAPGMLQPVTAMGFDAFQASLSVCRARRPTKLGIAKHPRIGGFIPPEESPPSVAVPHHCGRYPHNVGSTPLRAPKNVQSRIRVPRDMIRTAAPKRANAAEATPAGCKHPAESPVRQSTTKPKLDVQNAPKRIRAAEATVRLPLCTRHGAS